MPTAKLTSDDVEVQPRSGAWMMAYTSELIEAMDRAAPTGSSRVACGSRESGIRCSAPTKAATSSGTLIQNTDDHEKLRISAPPMIGPSAMPAPLAAVHAAIALARSRGSPNTLTRIDSVVGMISAPPSAHHAAPGDERRRRACRGGDDRAGEERGQAGEECVSAAEAVADASCGEEQAGEHDGVRGDDPLQAGRAGAEIADQAGAWRR